MCLLKPSAASSAPTLPLLGPVASPQAASASPAWPSPAPMPLAPQAGGPPPGGAAPSGSRRRRIWELDDHAPCPLLGVCLPIAVLRRVVDKAVGGQALADDYELHSGAVADCRLRSRVAEAVQRELDLRHALAVQRAGRLKTTEALSAWWDEALARHDIPGPFWAVMTHPRCTPELSRRVEGQIHMLQHQVGASTRMELERLQTLQHENAVLGRALGEAQARTTRLCTEHALALDATQGELMQLRAQLVRRDTELAAAVSARQALEAAAPDLPARAALAEDNQHLRRRVQDLQRQLSQVQRDAESLSRRLAAAEAGLVALRQEAPAPAAAPEGAAPLVDRAVLCVGGRSASIPIYREVIEGTGGRFLHHDGGEEDGTARLDTTLAAADLVICQTGCISHNAYWRVKEHCKRTGKPCVFVDTPSRSALQRALANTSLEA